MAGRNFADNSVQDMVNKSKSRYTQQMVDGRSRPNYPMAGRHFADSFVQVGRNRTNYPLGAQQVSIFCNPVSLMQGYAHGNSMQVPYYKLSSIRTTRDAAHNVTPEWTECIIGMLINQDEYQRGGFRRQNNTGQKLSQR